MRLLHVVRRLSVAALLSLGGLGARVTLAQSAAVATTPAPGPSASAAPLPTPKPPTPKRAASAAPSSRPAPSALPAASALPAPSALPADSAATLPSALPPPSAEPAPSALVAPSASAPTTPEPQAAASAPPVPSAAPPTLAGSPVQLGDDEVFVIRAPRGGKTAAQRAGDATRALAAATHEVKAAPEVKVQRRDDIAIVLVGPAPIVQLSAEDAVAAGDSSLDVHAAAVAAALREAIQREFRRAALAKAVFSISLLVFFGLIVFYLVRKVGEFIDRARVWVEANGERVLAVRVREIEVVSPATLKSTAVVGLSVAKWLGQLGILYAWLLVVLSLFEATRGYTERLTGFVVTPLSQLMTRIATGLPVLVVLAVAGFAVFVLVRFIGLFLGSVERRETTVAWLSADLAAPTSALVRMGVVLAALVFLVPLVTGNQEGALARSGAIVILALGLSAMPAFASAVLGSIVLFGRRLRPGQHVRFGRYAGRITSIGLLDLRLEDAAGAEIRVPHLYALYQPMSVLGLRQPLTLDVAVAPSARLAEVRDLLLRTVREYAQDGRVELVLLDAERAQFRILLDSDVRDTRSALQLAIAGALSRESVALGRLAPHEAPP